MQYYSNLYHQYFASTKQRVVYVQVLTLDRLNAWPNMANREHNARHTTEGKQVARTNATTSRHRVYANIATRQTVMLRARSTDAVEKERKKTVYLRRRRYGFSSPSTCVATPTDEIEGRIHIHRTRPFVVAKVHTIKYYIVISFTALTVHCAHFCIYVPRTRAQCTGYECYDRTP